MAGAMLRYAVVAVLVVALMSAFLPAVHAQAQAQAPSAPGNTSDGSTIDQGIAYVLLFLALVLTYLIHPLDAFPYNLL